jgi:LysR family transcriptional regulator, regulator of abg operon
MKLEQLQHLVAIVEHGSLRAAARRLGVPQPALTRSVRALERELGVELFVRSASGMTLTAPGRPFHRRAAAIVNEARRARDEVRQIAGGEQGNVVAALSIMPHVGMLPGALPAFQQRWPRVKLQLIEGLFPDIEHALRDGEIDFYLGAAPRETPAAGLVVEHLFDNTRAVFCRKGHALAGARSLKALAGAQWAATAVDYNADEDMARLFAQHGLPPPAVQLRARSAASMMVALAHTELLAMMPVQCTDFPMTRDALQVIRVRETLPAPAIVLVRRPDLPLTPAAEFFCDALVREGPVAPREQDVKRSRA